MKQLLVSELDEFLNFVRSLDSLNDQVWFSPISEGKWSIHDQHHMKQIKDFLD
ncbi:hypothetical protein HMSSN036_55050 [Paenibacillus macerans]|uniref:hypothetical protein n=1 Tax=Paenibacillus TaxID=44249 RepID=UPI002081F489|nr:hypothetical protein [Paenibacillus macerans]MEC0333197.1 hypothetical protein [Paenibacillus macerans]GJM73289.1 hypothetical protein HMSSN036_55050 [Paenibacillus macerans]